MSGSLWDLWDEHKGLAVINYSGCDRVDICSHTRWRCALITTRFTPSASSRCDAKILYGSSFQPFTLRT